MPQINKPKTKKTKKNHLPVVAKTTKPKKAKPSPVDYYHCLLTKAQNNWFDPLLGKKKKITQCCKDCKLKAPVLNESRKQEIQKLVISYQQVGDSLKKLLQPIK